MIPFGDIRVQHHALESEIHAAIHDVFDSGWFILGQQVEAFEIGACPSL